MASAEPAPTDRIERSILIAAPRERVWRALTDAGELGRWFGVDFHGQAFVEGQPIRGKLTVAGYDHLWMTLVVDRIEPMTAFAWRWHPHAVDPAVDYEREEPTLVAFTLADAPAGGTHVTVVESGFDRVPAHRRSLAFRMNTEGWEGQLRNIAAHVAA